MTISNLRGDGSDLMLKPEPEGGQCHLAGVLPRRAVLAVFQGGDHVVLARARESIVETLHLDHSCVYVAEETRLLSVVANMIEGGGGGLRRGVYLYSRLPQKRQAS